MEVNYEVSAYLGVLLNKRRALRMLRNNGVQFSVGDWRIIDGISLGKVEDSGLECRLVKDRRCSAQPSQLLVGKPIGQAEMSGMDYGLAGVVNVSERTYDRTSARLRRLGIRDPPRIHLYTQVHEA